MISALAISFVPPHYFRLVYRTHWKKPSATDYNTKTYMLFVFIGRFDSWLSRSNPNKQIDSYMVWEVKKTFSSYCNQFSSISTKSLLCRTFNVAPMIQWKNKKKRLGIFFLTVVINCFLNNCKLHNIGCVWIFG